jgi:hypothetical protein
MEILIIESAEELQKLKERGLTYNQLNAMAESLTYTLYNSDNTISVQDSSAAVIDGAIEFDDEIGFYVCSREDFEFWKKNLARRELFNSLEYDFLYSAMEKEKDLFYQNRDTIISELTGENPKFNNDFTVDEFFETVNKYAWKE